MKLKENLKIFTQAARARGEPVDHILFSGPPGLGKTSLAYIIAIEMGATAEDIARTIHAHPTLPEAMMEAAEAVHGMAVHIYQKK